MTTTPFDVCECGHIRRVCKCETFTPAEDPDAATEAARAAGERREAAYNDLRRAVANHRLEQAHAIIAELMKATS